MTPEQLTMMREDAAAARANANEARSLLDESGPVGLTCVGAEILAGHVDRLAAEVERLTAPTRGSLINALASAGAARVEAAAALRRAPLGPRTEEAQIKALAAAEAEERARSALDAFERADREADPCPGSRRW